MEGIDRFKLVIYVTLAGSGLLNENFSFKIQRMSAFYRNFALKLAKHSLKDFLQQITLGEVPVKPI